MKSNKPEIGTATHPYTTMNMHDDGSFLCNQLKLLWMIRQKTNTDPIIENREHINKTCIGWTIFVVSNTIVLITAGAVNAPPKETGLLVGLFLPLFIVAVGVMVLLYSIAEHPLTFYAYNPAFIALVDAVGPNHFIECWRLNNRCAFPMLVQLIKKQLVMATLVVLKLEDNGQRSEAETAKDRGFKPLHQAALAFGLVEEKWDSYFLEAKAILKNEKAGTKEEADREAAAFESKG